MKKLIFIFIIIGVNCFGQYSQGPNSPSAYTVNSSNYGTYDWTNPTNVYSSNDTYASVVLTNAYYMSYWLYTSTYGFTIPSGKVIKGIKIEVEINFPSDAAFYCRVGVSQTGEPSFGTNKTVSGFIGERYETWGGETDLWGGVWTVSGVNSVNFTVGFYIYSNAAGQTIQLDHNRVTIYYADAPTTALKAANTVTQATLKNHSGVSNATLKKINGVSNIL